MSSDEPTRALSHGILFQHFIPRYLRHPAVRDFLMNDYSPTAPAFASSVHAAMSYACMYIPPSAVPRHTAPYPPPTPFLDIGDFMLCENVIDGIAVGHLYNSMPEHALAVQRDKMLTGSTLSRKPTARKFAVDLRVPNLEIIEFAWMEDHSLIISCRRLDQTSGPAADGELVLSGDLLFYGVIPPSNNLGVPLLRMTLCEKPAICQFCRVRGIKTCECPASFKWRAPTKSAVPVPLAHAPFANAADTTLRIAPPAPEGRAGHSLAAWQNHTKRIFAVNTSGAFFVDWYKKSPDGSKMSRFMSPVHPVSYQFVCGTKQQTDSLASFYVTRMARCERATSADSRLYGSLSRGSHIGMIVDKINHQHMDTDPSHLQDVVTYFDTETPQYPMSAYPHVRYDQQVFTTSGPQSFGDVSSTNPSLDSDDFVPSPAMPLQDPHALHNTPKSTSTTITGDSSGLSNGDVASNSPYEFDNYKQPEYFMDDVVPSQDPNSLNAHGVHGLPEGASLSRNMPNNSNGNAQYMDKAGTLSTNDIKVQNLMTVDEANTPMCKKCNSTFLKRGNLGRHIQTVHLKLKPFQCDHCSQSFGYKNHLKRHQIIHQRGKDLKCRICSLQFKGQAQLTKHVQLEHQQGSPDSQGGYHSSVADRPHISCDDCGTRFSQRSNLVRHLHIHEGMRFPCPVCPSKSFGQRYDLRRHVSSKHPDYSGSQLASVAPQRVERVE